MPTALAVVLALQLVALVWGAYDLGVLAGRDGALGDVDAVVQRGGWQ